MATEPSKLATVSRKAVGEVGAVGEAAGHERGDDLGVGGDLGGQAGARRPTLRSAKLSTSPFSAAVTNGPRLAARPRGCRPDGRWAG